MTDGDDLIARIEQAEARIEKLEKLFAGTPSLGATKKQSAKEFLMTKQVKTDTQKVVALAYFLENQERLTSFNVSDLEAIFRSAREKLPKNMNDAVNKNIARGFLMEASERKNSKKAWHLTATGEKFVEDKLKGGQT